MSKQAQLRKLAKKRQDARRDGYNNVCDYHEGAYECDFVSPYTKSARNVDARVMVFLQDWVSDDVLKGKISESRRNLGHDPDAPANTTLWRLLNDHLHLKLTAIYATNLFPLIKMGAKSSRIPMRDMKWAAREFGLPQLEIVKPTLAICLGLQTFNALRLACGRDKCKPMSNAIDNPYCHEGTLVFCQAHTSPMGQNNRGREQVEEDWKRMTLWYRKWESRQAKLARIRGRF